MAALAAFVSKYVYIDYVQMVLDGNDKLNAAYEPAGKFVGVQDDVKEEAKVLGLSPKAAVLQLLKVHQHIINKAIHSIIMDAVNFGVKKINSTVESICAWIQDHWLQFAIIVVLVLAAAAVGAMVATDIFRSLFSE